MNILEKVNEIISLTELGFEKYPPGWTRKSVKKFADSITDDVGKDPDEEGWFDA